MAANSILKSIAIKFDLYSNSGEGIDSTGLYANGASPTTPYVDLTGTGIDLHSGHVFNAHMTYDGTNLIMTLTDTVTAAKFTQTWPINLASTIGSSTAYFGFTGGTGGLTAIQDIISWTYSSGSPTLTAAATPTFSPAAGTYASAQSVTLSDATAGSTIFYTTDGSTPTTSSTKYTLAISVGTTTTIKAIATAPNFTTSLVGIATYTIQTAAATPTFSPVAGTYSSTQSVALSDTTSGATIYYTTDGSTPTTASTKYTGAISVPATTTLKAIAVATGFSNSAVASATYTISGSTNVIGFSSGFPSANGLQFNGGSSLNGTRLRVTDGGASENRSAFWTTPVNVQTFTTDFTFQQAPGTNPTGDGFAFVLQNSSIAALGIGGGGLGYGPDTPGAVGGIPNSIAIKFDLYSNAGEGTNSTGLYTNGASPTTPAVDLTSSGVSLHSADVMRAHISYDGATLSLTLSDTVTGASFTNTWPINIATTIGLAHSREYYARC
jgi:hypothetical protein